jgi:hypothetical protein
METVLPGHLGVPTYFEKKPVSGRYTPLKYRLLCLSVRRIGMTHLGFSGPIIQLELTAKLTAKPRDNRRH